MKLIDKGRYTELSGDSIVLRDNKLKHLQGRNNYYPISTSGVPCEKLWPWKD